jgi:hypothetical protein
MKSNQAMQLTASKLVVSALGICHPGFWFHDSRLGTAADHEGLVAFAEAHSGEFRCRAT